MLTKEATRTCVSCPPAAPCVRHVRDNSQKGLCLIFGGSDHIVKKCFPYLFKEEKIV